MKKRLRLKKWVKVVLVIIVVLISCIAIYRDYSKETINGTPVGEYTCRGSIIQLCSGSNEVKDYLG